MSFHGDSIDLNSNIPYYVQLIDLIKTKIANKVWQVAIRFLVSQTCVSSMVSAGQLYGRLSGNWSWMFNHPPQGQGNVYCRALK